MRLNALLLALLFVGCQATTPDADDQPEEATSAAEEATGPTRAEVEAPAQTTPIVRAPTGATLRLRPIETATAEDGHGAEVTAVAPVALDLIRETGWPGRAADPVLTVGELQFFQYYFPTPDTLRFIAADGSTVDPTTMEISLQYGDDAESRIVPRLAE